MNVISFISTKSMGKSTGVQTLTNALLRRGVAVHVVALDPQQSHRYFTGPVTEAYPDLFQFTPYATLSDSNNIVNRFYDIVDAAEEEEGVLLIDVQGTDNNLISPAAGASDLVLVPLIDGDMERLEAMTTFEKLVQIDREIKRSKGLKHKDHPQPVLQARVYHTRNSLATSNDARKTVQTAEGLGFPDLGCNLKLNGLIGKLPVTGLIPDPSTLSGAEKQKAQKAWDTINPWVQKIEMALAEAIKNE